MVISLVLLFITCLSLSFVEDRLSDRDKKIIYAILGFVIYVFLIMGMSYLFMWDELMAVFKTGMGFIRKKLHK